MRVTIGPKTIYCHITWPIETTSKVACYQEQFYSFYIFTISLMQPPLNHNQFSLSSSLPALKGFFRILTKEKRAIVSMMAKGHAPFCHFQWLVHTLAHIYTHTYTPLHVYIHTYIHTSRIVERQGGGWGWGWGYGCVSGQL